MSRHRAITRPSWAPGRACDTTAWAYNTARPGCDTVEGPTTTQCHRAARSHGLGEPGRAGWSVGCALGAPNQFLTQHIVSESLFGLLFMNTVHKIFRTKNEIKFLKNKIK